LDVPAGAVAPDACHPAVVGALHGRSIRALCDELGAVLQHAHLREPSIDHG
jgi:hypothetical protein